MYIFMIYLCRGDNNDTYCYRNKVGKLFGSPPSFRHRSSQSDKRRRSRCLIVNGFSYFGAFFINLKGH